LILEAEFHVMFAPGVKIQVPVFIYNFNFISHSLLYFVVHMIKQTLITWHVSF